MTAPAKLDEFNHAEDPAFAKGRLMSVDWADGSARLDKPDGDFVLLLFDVGNIEMENRLRRFATCHVDVQGHLSSNGSQQVLDIIEIEHALLEPEPEKEPNDGPLTEEDWDNWMLAIREGRDGLCGECRRRAAAI